MRRPFVSRRSIAVITASITLVGAVVGLFLADSQLTHNAHTASERALVAAAKGNPVAASSAAKSRVVTPATPDVHDVLFIGASYTAGLGADPATDGYAYVIGREPGWRTQVYGVAGTGFLNPGPQGGQTFAERLVHIPTRPRPDLIVFQCGRNDVSYPAAQLRAAVIETANLARQRFGSAQLVFLGPIPAHVPVPPDQLAAAATLRSAAAAAKAVFINPIEQGWITPTNEDRYVGHVPAHPDNDGYAYIAARLLTDLDALFPEHGSV